MDSFMVFRYSEHHEGDNRASWGHAERRRSRTPAASRTQCLDTEARRTSESQPGNDQCHRERQDRYLGPAATPNRGSTRRTCSVAHRGSDNLDATAEPDVILG